ncbi:MAG: ABC transporter permease, partial [Bacteroidota bacterium]
MYFSTILKVFKRSRINVFINLLGLVIGISSAILIFLYVQNEFSYDQYHEKIDRIYRITANDRPNDGENHNIALANYFLAQIFLEEYPEVEDVVRLSFMDGSP